VYKYEARNVRGQEGEKMRKSNPEQEIVMNEPKVEYGRRICARSCTDPPKICQNEV